MARAAPLFLAPDVSDEFFSLTLDPTSTATPKEEVPELPGNEFMDLLREAMPPGGVARAPFSHTTAEGHLMGLTENFSATYLTSGDACLDFFFQVVPGMDEEEVVSLLKRAWEANALTTLKLVFHLRGVRGTGKSDKEAFYWAALWLHKHHPATLLENMPMVAEFGYFKDFLEVLLRLVEGAEVTENKAEAKFRHKAVISRGKSNAKLWEQMQNQKKQRSFGRFQYRRRPAEVSGGGYYSRKGAAARAVAEAGTLKPREERIAASVEKDRAASKKAALARKDKKLALAHRVAKIYDQDLSFQALYSKVADVFAHRLVEDLKALQEERVFDISLAGKWVPSPDSSYDVRTLLCYAIATRIFPKEAHPEYDGMDNQQYGVAVRERLRKEVLVPLRKSLDLPEVYMSARKWVDVNYRRVASVAMTNYKTLFLKHDEERFNEYLGAVKRGEEKIAAGALLPHDILRGAVLEDGQSAEVAELQWKRMVEDLKEHGTLSNCLAVCDVSGSMSGEPMEVCIALGMLLSDLSEEPWKGHVITFSQNPQIHLLAGESLKQKYEFAETMEADLNTNLQRVFDKILTMAQLNKLAPEKMIRRLFIFSDMEFDEANSSTVMPLGMPWGTDYAAILDRLMAGYGTSSSTPSWETDYAAILDRLAGYGTSSSTPSWETDYAAISRKFKLAGYGTPPQIVFWNLRSSQSIPVLKSQQGVALVSGFSKNILKIFLEDDGAVDPMKAMHSAIKGEEYTKLKVVD